MRCLRIPPYNCGVRLVAKSFVVVWLAIAVAWLPAARAENLRPDTEESSRLTDYLHSHHLPLVGAQVLNSATGARTVLLFGYTATAFGKGDAETKSRRFLKDADVTFNNHIAVRPELASMRSPSQSAPSAATAEEAPPPSEMGDIENYQNQQENSAQQQYMNQQTQQYMNQGNSTGGLANTLIPLLGMGLAIGLGGGGSGIGMGVSPGFGGSLGGSPYGGSQYGSPYGGSGGYGNPSPYGPSPYGAPGSGANPYP